jgi:MFS family permease
MAWLRNNFHELAGGLPRSFWYVWSSNLINRLGSFVLVVLALYLSGARHFSTATVGLILGMYGAGAAAGALVGGVLSDRWGRRATVLLSHVSAGAITVCLAFATDVLTVAVLACTLGLVASLARPATGALIVDVVPEPDRMRAYSLYGWATNIGITCAAMLAGVLAETSFVVVFVLDATTTVAAGVLVFLNVPETTPSAGAATTDTRPGSLGDVVRDKTFVLFVAVGLLFAMIFVQSNSSLPLAMQQDGLSASTFGWVFALNSALVVVGQLFVPKLVKGRDTSHVLAAGGLLVGAGFGLTAFAHSAWAYAVTVVVWTCGVILGNTAAPAVMASLSPAHLRGRYQGVALLSFAGATFAGPIIGAQVLQRWGTTPLWLSCLAAGLVVAVCHVTAGPSRARRAADLVASAAPGDGGLAKKAG